MPLPVGVRRRRCDLVDSQVSGLSLPFAVGARPRVALSSGATEGLCRVERMRAIAAVDLLMACIERSVNRVRSNKCGAWFPIQYTYSVICFSIRTMSQPILDAFRL